MIKRGLPIAGVDALDDLPLNPVDEPAPFLRPKNRMRARRVRRGATARAVLVLQATAALFITVAAVWAGYSSVMASERLRVGKVEVRGSRFLSDGEVRELLGPAVGENILGLDIEALKTRLRASPWVADATVARTLPDTLKVDVQERVPLALAEVDRLYLMDEDGDLIDVYGPRTAAFDLPIVRGLIGVEGDARRDRAQRAGVLLRDLGDLGAEVSEVFVEPSGDLRVVLRGVSETVLMGTPPYRKRFVTFLGLRKELAERCPKALYFDLRFRGRIYAKMPEPPPSPKAQSRPTPPNPPEVPAPPAMDPGEDTQ
jgi:cell division protein FtsQ